MSLDAKSTFEDIRDEYNNTASYAETGDVDKAKRFVTACRFMLNPTFLPKITEHSGERVELFLEALERQLEEAQDFVTEEGILPGEGIVYHSFENSRG